MADFLRRARLCFDQRRYDRARTFFFIGTYEIAFSGQNGRVKDNGKYVVVWIKVDGAWRVLSDIFNTNVAAQ